MAKFTVTKGLTVVQKVYRYNTVHCAKYNCLISSLLHQFSRNHILPSLIDPCQKWQDHKTFSNQQLNCQNMPKYKIMA